MTVGTMLGFKSGTDDPSPVTWGALGTDDKIAYVKAGVEYYIGQDGVPHPRFGVPLSRILTAGAGMTGGGDLSADRTFDVVAADASIIVGANSINTGAFNDLSTLHPATGTISANSQRIAALIDPVNAQDAATKAYVDNLIAALPSQALCNYATAAALASVTYANGASGVGATLTATAPGVLVVDGAPLTVLNTSVLVQNQVSAFQNGIYRLTTVGTGLVPFVLTRRASFDSASEMGTSVLVPIDDQGLTPGATNDDKVFLSLTSSPFTVGTTSITFQLIGSTYSADGTSITLSGTQFSRAALTGDITAPAGSAVTTLANVITAGSAGSGTAVPVITYDAKGRITAVTTAATVGTITAADSSIVIGGTATAPTVQRAALTGDVTASAGSNATTLASVITAGGPTGSTSVVPVITYDAKGRITSVTTATITAASIGAQPVDTTLTALAAANWALDALPIGTGADTLSQVAFAANTFPAKASTGALVAKTITDFGLSLVDDTNASAAQSTLGLVIGTNVQAFDSDLATIAGLTATTDNFMQAKAGAWASRTVAQVKTDLGLAGTNTGDQTITLTGDVTGSGTGSFAATLANVITAGGPTGSATVVPVITYDAKGRLTAVTTAAITAGGIGAVASVTAADASIVVAGTSTNPTVSRAALTGDVTAPAGSNATTLASVITAGGPTGSSTSVPVITYDAKGRLTAVTTAATVGSVAATDSSIVVAGTATAPTIQRAALTGDITASAGSNATTLASIITAGGPTGSGTAVPVVTYDAKGRLTAVTTAATVGTVAATDATVTIGGTATAPTFATGRLDQIATLRPATASITANSQKIVSLADGTVATDAVNLGQLTAAVEGRRNKDAVLWGTTGNITLSGLGTQGNGEWTGALTAGDRILVKSQSSSAANGIYIAAAGAWTRATDADTGAEITNATVLILFGASLTGDTYSQTATVATIGTDPQTWVQTGEGATLTADGTSITLTGNTFSRNALTGDVTAPAGSSVTTLASVITAGGPTGSASVVPVITYDAKGRLTAVTTATITPAAIGAVASVTAADTSVTVAGTATNPTISRAALTGDVTAGAGSNATTLASLITAGGPIGSTSVTPVITWDAKGRLTAVTSATITPAAIGAVASVAAADGSVVVAGTATNPTISRAALTGDITASAGSNATTLANAGPGATGPIGSTSVTPVVTIDAKGRVTALTSATITPAAIGAPSGSGTSSGTNTGDQTITLTGDVTGSGTGSFAATLASVVSAGSVGSSTQIPVITYDAKGRITAVTTATPSAGISSLTAVGVAPNANAGTIGGGGTTLTLQPASAAFAGVMSASDYARIRAVLNAVSDFGFVGDSRVTFDGGSNTVAPTKITSATMGFTAADVGKRITLSFAGAASGNAKYVGVITAIDSATQVTVSPNIQRTVGPNGLIVETDNTTAIGTMATAINALTYPGVKIVWPASATNRFGFPTIVPILNKPVTMSAQGRFYNDDYGNYWNGGGTALVWSGPSWDGGTAFRGLFRFEPVTGASAQHMHGTSFEDIWIDARNGDQFQLLYPIQMYSQEGFSFRRFGCIDAIGAAVEFDITSPIGGTAATARGTMEDFGIRALDPDAAVSTPTVTTTSSAVTLSTTPQNLTVAAVVNTLYSAGYAWFETEAGYPVLVNFTGGGTTTTLTGCTVSAKDSALTPKTLSGCNVVFAHPGNSAALKFGGDSNGNTNLAHFRMGQINHGTTYGPAAMDLRNADSILFQQVVINGGNGAVMATGPTVKRITKPGYRLTGSDASINLACRNIIIQDGDAGAGGVSSMATKGGGTKMVGPAGPNYLWGLQFGNGQPAPIIELGSYLDWTTNGGTTIGLRNISMTPTVTFTAGANKVIDGTVMLLGPQAFQIGTTFHWEFAFNKSTAAGTTSHTLTIRVGATGTTTDAVVQTFTLTTTAVTDNSIMEVDFLITTLTGGNANGAATIRHKAKAAATGAGFWSASTGSILVATPAAFAAPVSGLQYISLQMNTGSATVSTSSFGMGEVTRVGLQAA